MIFPLLGKEHIVSNTQKKIVKRLWATYLMPMFVPNVLITI